ncbi:MAG: succinate dehydrogenase cytochrome b subunit [Odoribacteraceae bacterium]|jgi:succinate dehydrogenase / fumarate reductase cytochrome b subunit|nr:succinate dehydrogenase cytochrome b subunit [Odoribacteraceae bacterium]
MSSFITSSIGKKAIMGASGFFLVSFLCVHLTANLMIVADSSGETFNEVCHFMATNPVVRVIEPALALGFLLHIALASWLTLQNMAARPVKYARSNQAGNASWASRNMYILGSLILVFLLIHLWNFWWKIKFAGDPLLAEIEVDGVLVENTYALVSGLFKTSVAYCGLYILGSILLGLHLAHGFGAAFQSVGLSNRVWRKRWNFLGMLFAIVIAAGFSIIPIYFLLGLGG